MFGIFSTALPPTKHKATPLLVLFRARISSFPLERTLRGFIKCFLYYYLIIIYILIILYSARGKFGGNPVPVVTGREFGGYGCGPTENYPRDTRVHHYSLSSLSSSLSSHILFSLSSLCFLPLLSPPSLFSISPCLYSFHVKYFLFESISFFVLLYTILLFI